MSACAIRVVCQVANRLLVLLHILRSRVQHEDIGRRYYDCRTRGSHGDAGTHPNVTFWREAISEVMLRVSLNAPIAANGLAS